MKFKAQWERILCVLRAGMTETSFRSTSDDGEGETLKCNNFFIVVHAFICHFVCFSK